VSVRHPKAARRRPARSSSGESEGVTTWRIAASRDDDRAPDQTNALDLAALSHLDPPPESVRDVKERLKWGTDRATKALQVWRSSFLTHRYSNEEHACHAAHRRHAHPGAGGLVVLGRPGLRPHSDFSWSHFWRYSARRLIRRFVQDLLRRL
jgi:hypothetical protein